MFSFFRKPLPKVLDQPDTYQVLSDLESRIKMKGGYDKAHPNVQRVWLLWVLRTEYQQGSLDAYATNSAGNLYGDTVALLQFLDATEALAVLVELDDLIGGKMRSSRDERKAAFERLYNAGRKKGEKDIRDLTDRLDKAWPALMEKAIAHFRTNPEGLD